MPLRGCNRPGLTRFSPPGLYLYDLGLRLWTLANYVKDGKFDCSIPDEAFKEINNYWANILNDRRKNPQNDYATQVAHATMDGKPISDLIAFSTLTRTTTRAFDNAEIIITSCALKLAQNPELFQQMKNNKALLPHLIEEINRWVCPSVLATRTASADYVIRGQKIKAGDVVKLCWNSANRDEEVIEDPFTFRIDRKPNKHLSFGSGPHVCPGRSIAGLLVTTLLEELVTRLDVLELSKEVSYSVLDFKVHYNELFLKYEIARQPGWHE